MSKATPLAYAGILGATFFWGTNFNAGAYIIKGMAPLSASIERFSISTLLLLVIFGVVGKLRLSTLKNNLAAFIGLGLLGFTGFSVATFFGLQTTTPINGALILATTPLWTMILAVLLEGERIDRGRAIGLVFGLLGVGLVITKGDIQVLLGLRVVSGDAMILAGSMAWAANMVGTRRFVKDSTPLETTSFSMLFGVIGLIVLGFMYEDPIASIRNASLPVHEAVIYLAVCGSVVAYLLWFKGIHAIGAARTSIFFNLAPVFTMLVSSVMGVLPNVWQLLGAGGVILGVLFASGMVFASAKPTVVAAAQLMK
ncbi:DMT family transporter [Pseudomonas sp. PCH199]|uniref:DMT family transporter n=1 Tax=unclassified Pseudomonas TaxID=196821 RepID=UPI000BD3941B|nr:MULTISPECIES: DMT family transporter [unclassified Pseudomonas]MCW8275119.1 DMT family transporter [Pseudomonas sp. PCH199]PAM84791.1 EamA family transporter [Pseudomonas sp. ERMR1:02]